MIIESLYSRQFKKKNNLNKIPVVVPPLPLQTQIVAHLDALSDRITAAKARQQTQLTELRALKASLLDRAFRGEL